VSHHFDSAADRADGRINPCDLYAFPGAPGTTALILTVNPDAGRSSPTTFRPDTLYEFVVASDGGTARTSPCASPSPSPTRTGSSRSGSLQRRRPRRRQVPPSPGRGALRPRGVHHLPRNTFAGRDVTAIVLQLPDATLGGTRIGLWARIGLTATATPGQRQVSRIGQPMLRPLFFNPPDTEAELDALNAGAPATDQDAHGDQVRCRRRLSALRRWRALAHLTTRDRTQPHPTTWVFGDGEQDGCTWDPQRPATLA
jgi:hypothetical protein